MIEPELELVSVGLNESFKIWSHGSPFRTVRWHFHPEYEVHLITSTTGRAFVGDYVGTFEPMNLVMTGPNLPHNWVSDLAPGVSVDERCIVLQFTDSFITDCIEVFPELGLSRLLDDCQRGILFDCKTARLALPVMRSLLEAKGSARPKLFFQLMGILLDSPDRKMMASVAYNSLPVAYLAQPINLALSRIAEHLASDFPESKAAKLSGYTPSAFSRLFHRQTGMTYTCYVNSIRIHRACQMLASTNLLVTDICYQVGFNNLSNFNRQFVRQTRMTPREYRLQHRGHTVVAPDRSSSERSLSRPSPTGRALVARNPIRS